VAAARIAKEVLMSSNKKSNSSGITRRAMLAYSAAAVTGAMLFGKRFIGGAPARAAENEHFDVQHTDAEWRAKLTPAQYSVLREEGTERAFTSPLDEENRKGVFACAGCDLHLYSSDTKFDSGTGWPSFWQPLPNAVNKRVDTSLGMERDEVHCRRCGGHLGHVFDDGPRPTGLRYCMNGVALTFTPGATS
jgi:peptide-methionine (R)-S-oxide reductase